MLTSAAARYRGRKQGEEGLDEPLSGLSPDSFWPTLGSLVNMLTDAGFGLVKILSNHLEHENGPAVTIAASIENRNPEGNHICSAMVTRPPSVSPRIDE